MPPIEAPYALGSANEAIPLYTGPGTLHRSDGHVVSGATRLDFVWLPSPRLAFELQAATSPMAHEPPAYELSLDEMEGRPSGKAFIGRVRIGAESQTLGSTGAITVGGGPVNRMVFLLPNWPSMLGSWIDAPNGTGGWRGRTLFDDHEWRLRLEARPDITAVTDELRTTGGYAATHVGEFERLDGASFEVDEGREFLRSLSVFFAFARGFWTPPTLAVGLQGTHVVWRDWSGLISSPWRSNLSWFAPQSPDTITGLFPRFMDRWRDPRWRQSLELAVSWLVEANPSDPAERSIVLAQVALELMGWLILVEDERVIPPKAWKQGRDKAKRHTRSLLQHARISTAIPPERQELASLAKAEHWVDGPQALVGFRNKLVHPRNRAGEIFSTPMMARVELAEVASWYCELALLYFCGYQGDYLNRNTLNLEPVPWV